MDDRTGGHSLFVKASSSNYKEKTKIKMSAKMTEQKFSKSLLLGNGEFEFALFQLFLILLSIRFPKY